MPRIDPAKFYPPIEEIAVESTNRYVIKMQAKLQTWFGRGWAVTAGVLLSIVLTIGLGVIFFLNSSVPTTITIASGPEGSSFSRNAEKYKKLLAKDGVTLKIVPSEGSSENLKRLTDPKETVDVGFVLGGEVAKASTENLVSLGSVNYQPILIFYQGAVRRSLSEFKGGALDIGPEGSGRRNVSLELLKANGLEPKSGFVEIETKDLVAALREKSVDAVFVMGDSTPSEVIRKLFLMPGVHLFDFTQADAYVRRINYLNKLTLPKGSLDLGRNLPETDMQLLSPTVELIARDSLHPALSDLLLAAAQEVHSGPGLFRKRGEFPVAIEHEFRLSPEATRYYASGKTFLYRTFPFWLASLIARILAVIVPIGLLIVPALKIAPAIYRWRMESRIHRWYKALLELERHARNATHPARREELLQQLNHIETSVDNIVVPASFGDMFYGLREHVTFVRRTLTEHPTQTQASPASVSA